MLSNFVASCTGNGNANTGSAKRLKNEENHADQVMNDDGLIKRIRLDSQDKEKNIQLEMERTVSDRFRFCLWVFSKRCQKADNSKKYIQIRQ